MSFCSQCGAPNADDARACEKCGTPIGAVAPPPPPPAPAAPQPAAVPAGGGKKINPLLIVGVIVLVVVLGLGVALTRPMSKRDYKKEAENQSEDLVNASTEILDAVYEVAYNYEDADDDLDSSDVEDLRDTFDDESKKVKEAAREIRGLRPPSECKDGDKDLRVWADWMAGDGLKMLDDLIKEAEKKDMTYEDFEDVMNDFSDEWDDESDDAYDALADAADELNIEPYGETYEGD